jgi:hypothetical protein
MRRLIINKNNFFSFWHFDVSYLDFLLFVSKTQYRYRVFPKKWDTFILNTVRKFYCLNRFEFLMFEHLKFEKIEIIRFDCSTNFVYTTFTTPTFYQFQTAANLINWISSSSAFKILLKYSHHFYNKPGFNEHSI